MVKRRGVGTRTQRLTQPHSTVDRGGTPPSRWHTYVIRRSRFPTLAQDEVSGFAKGPWVSPAPSETERARSGALRNDRVTAPNAKSIRICADDVKKKYSFIR